MATPVAGAGDRRPPADREELETVDELVEGEDAVHAIGGEQRLPGGVVARECARVSGDHLAAGRRAADRQRHDGDVALERPCESGPEPVGVAERLEEQADDAGLVELDCVAQVVGGG